MNFACAFCCDIRQPFFDVMDVSIIPYVAYQMWRRPVVNASDALDDEESVYLLFSDPKDITGLALSTSRFIYGNRMVVYKEHIYLIRRSRFTKVPLSKEKIDKMIKTRTLTNTGKGYDQRLDDLTGRLAIPLLFDCRQYEVIFGNAREIRRSRLEK